MFRVLLSCVACVCFASVYPFDVVDRLRLEKEKKKRMPCRVSTKKEKKDKRKANKHATLVPFLHERSRAIRGRLWRLPQADV